MNQSINVAWNGGMSFKTNLDGHEIVIDTTVENGGNNLGPRTKALVMVALAGCTGMDLVSLLNKMRVSFSELNIKVESNLADEHPKKYDAMKVIFEISGTHLDIEKIEKAVKLSEERYCGVWATLKPAVAMSYEIKLIEN